MSGEGGIEIPLMVIGGAVYLAYKGTELAVRGAYAGIKGTARMVQDANISRKLNQAVKNGDADAVRRMQHYYQRRGLRDRDYDLLIRNAHENFQQLLAGVENTMRKDRRQFEQAIDKARTAHHHFLQKRVDAFQNVLDQTEKTFSDNIAEVSQGIDRQFDQERQAVENAISMQDQTFQTAMNQQQDQLQDQINQFQTQIVDQQQSAAGLMNLVQDEIRFVDTHYRHDFFAPRALAGIQQASQMAVDTFNAGNFQASLAAAQNRVVDILQLKNRLETMTQTWETQRAMTLETLHLAESALNAVKTIDVAEIDVGGQEISDPQQITTVETDHWTKGEWKKNVDRIVSNKKHLETDDCSLSIDELARLSEEAHQAINQASILATQAKLAVVGASMRAHVQETFAEQMIEAGYTIEDNVYAGNDDRNANHLILCGPNGEQLAIALAPEEQMGILSQSIEVNFHDENINARERERIVQEMRQRLAGIYGLDPQSLPYTCKAGTDFSTNAAPHAFNPQTIKQNQPNAGRTIS
ncbi:hypothetical protein [Desulfobacter latus]|uniref:Uncharacterized protein n=1 Tax=Desulfobacter latus TaxID=2292 RepID=A0A850T6M5_9BACT|nr:hypothetical protein [Desulfobacter latus]NWH03877.1 hypothetical protein [Desulfobacter latus]